ncbi:MAG: TonB-dependent receptor [Saprospiraceae bacterium]|nr:TonB-dependent receptor [Saprospiraceae bacterium]
MKEKSKIRNRKSEIICNLILLLLLIWTSAAGQQVLRGKVIDADSKEILHGANILIIGTQVGTSTDSSGAFLLTVPSHGRLQISFIGYIDIIIDLDTINLNEVLNIEMISEEVIIDTYYPVIYAPRIPVTLNTPAPVMKMYPEDLQRDDNLMIAPALNRIPGVYMQNGTLSTNRISIRGIGSRSLFSTAKIRTYLDEIPVTNGVGETSLEDIDLSLLSEVEIYKGPTASVYGAGLGGLIHLKSLNYEANLPSSASTQFQMGSFGLIRNVTTLNLNSNKARLDLNYNKTHSDGWRDNNKYDREGFTALSKLNIIKNGITTLLANYTHVKGFIPSSLNKNDFENNPERAAFIWKNINGFEEYDKILAGLSHQQSFNKIKNTTSLFTTWRNAYEPRPFGILDENSLAFGARTRLDYNNSINAIIYSLGSEVFSEHYDWQNYQIRSDATKDTLLQDNKEQRFYYNVFAEAEWRLDSWTLNAGVNMNQTNYDLEDRFLKDGNDLSGEYNFKTILSPRIGLVYRPKDNINVYGTVSHGFSPSTLEETLTPSGAINSDIQPEQGWNFEIGSRGHHVFNKLSYEITFYTMQIRDLLVARRTDIGQFVGVNAGKTTHNGIEAYLHYDIFNNKILQTFVGYTFADYNFKDFVDGDNDYSGNKLTGTSPHIASAGLDFTESRTGLYGNITFQFTDVIPLNDANSLYSNAYKLLNSKIGWRKNLGTKWNFNIYTGINNILDEKYASMLQINALGPAFRYYYPGLPRNFYGGVSLRMTW